MERPPSPRAWHLRGIEASPSTLRGLPAGHHRRAPPVGARHRQELRP